MLVMPWWPHTCEDGGSDASDALVVTHLRAKVVAAMPVMPWPHMLRAVKPSASSSAVFSFTLLDVTLLRPLIPVSDASAPSERRENRPYAHRSLRNTNVGHVDLSGGTTGPLH